MKRTLTIVLAILMVFTTGIFSLSAIGAPAQDEIIEAAPDKDLVLLSRFENILNKNFAYGDALSSIDAIINASQLSLLDKAENGVISNSHLIDFASDMYGADLTVFADEGKEPLKKNGVTQILPRGYSIYNHTATKYTLNADGTYTVYSDVKTFDHDGTQIEFEAITLFVKSENSSFGYYIVSSELIDKINTAELAI